MSDIKQLRRDLRRTRGYCYYLEDRLERLSDVVCDLYDRAAEGELRLATQQSMVMRDELGRLDS